MPKKGGPDPNKVPSKSGNPAHKPIHKRVPPDTPDTKRTGEGDKRPNDGR